MPDLPSSDAAAALVAARRSVHTFRPVPVPDAVLRQALEAARWAPNHRHTQPWRFFLFGPESAERLVALNAELVAARQGEAAAENKRQRWAAVPAWVAVAMRPEGDALRAREDYAACACAVQNLQLVLHAAGVGAKWTTGPVTRDPRFLALLGAPADTDVVALLMVGYPADVPAPPQRKELDEVLTVLP